jgi:hypothetical protein
MNCRSLLLNISKYVSGRKSWAPLDRIYTLILQIEHEAPPPARMKILKAVSVNGMFYWDVIALDLGDTGQLSGGVYCVYIHG